LFSAWLFSVGAKISLPRFSLTAVAFVMGLCVAAFAAGDEKVLSPKVTFDIPAQSLVTALQAYSAASGVQVLYESSLATGQKSTELRGEFTREAALKKMVEGNDLVIQYSRANAITLVNPRAAALDKPPAHAGEDADTMLDPLYLTEVEPGPDESAVAGYKDAIQQEVQAALRKASTTRAGSYRVGVNLWIDPSRTITQTEIFQSTGSPQRDTAISDVLEGMVVRRQAPAGLAQPVRIMIRSL
jgi:hypothetical protein